MEDKEQPTSKIKVDDYGQMLATINDLEPVFYAEAGSYQGMYIAINADKTRLFLYADSYGSCSGCDWLEDEKDWSTGEVDYKAAVEYCEQSKPKLILPKEHYEPDYLKAVINGLLDYKHISDDEARQAAAAIDKHISETA